MCDQDHSVTCLPMHSARTNCRGGALAPFLLPATRGNAARIAGAADVVENDIDIKTPDGTADSYFVHPRAECGRAY